MSIKNKLTSVAAAAAIAAGSLTPIASAPAQAGGLYTGNGAELHYVQRRGKRFYKRGRGHHRDWRHHHARPHYYKRKRDRTGKYVALGIGALMLGIIASQAARSHHRSYDHYDY